MKINRRLYTVFILLFFLACQSMQPVARYNPKFSPSNPSGIIENSKAGNPISINEKTEQTKAANRFKVGEAPDDVLRKAIAKWLGTPYRYGGMSLSGIDCSGFTTVIFNEVYGIQLPRRAKDQYLLGRSVEVSSLKQGDLVFFQLPKTRAVSHVGIYLSDGQFAHASTSSGVMYSSLKEDHWVKLYKGARRIN